MQFGPRQFGTDPDDEDDEAHHKRQRQMPDAWGAIPAPRPQEEQHRRGAYSLKGVAPGRIQRRHVQPELDYHPHHVGDDVAEIGHPLAARSFDFQVHEKSECHCTEKLALGDAFSNDGEK